MNCDLRDDYLAHVGTPHEGYVPHSGRYPYGSGDTAYQRAWNFQARVHKLEKQGMSQVDIAKSMGMTTTQLRKEKSISSSDVRRYNIRMARKLKDRGMSQTAIAKRLRTTEGSVRNWLKESAHENNEKTQRNADILKDYVDRYDYIQIGGGVELYLGITRNRLNNAVELLRKKGYTTHEIYQEQLGTGKMTTIPVLCKPETTLKDVLANTDKVRLPMAYSEDGGQTMRKIEPPVNVDSKRVAVRYGDEVGPDGHTGVERDGLIELRRGVADISLGNAKYAQVRIAVDGTHYLKGMAVYSDNLPDGVDILFNTNKSKDTPMMGPKDNTVLKPLKTEDPENPFGAALKPDDKIIRCHQSHYIDKNGNEQQSAINVVNEEGDWSKWNRILSSQILAKQPVSLAKQQLKLKRDELQEEFGDIMKMTNPTIKADQLEDFARKCDAQSAHMEAAALPRQSNRVLLPVPSLKDNEIYAPGYNDGDTVVLIRFPHAGIFEIPKLRVNNKNPEAKSFMNNALDAVGVNSKVLGQLSGADTDGDSVVVIPVNDKVNIRTSPPLQALSGFDPKAEYPGYPGMNAMTSHQKGIEMGRTTNLIMDMQVLGANVSTQAGASEVARAVKHSMVVIDAEKHKLNWRQSEIDQGIAELREKYQGSKQGGKGTLLTRANADVDIERRREKAPSKMTPEELERWKEGYQIWENTGRTKRHGNVDRKLMTPEEKKAWDEGGNAARREITRQFYKDGRIRITNDVVMDKVPMMSLHEDAYDLVSGTKETTTRIEAVYADHANALKEMARLARKEARALDDIPYDPSAAQVYAKEVDSLKAKVRQAQRDAPMEREAQLLAGNRVKTKIAANPDMDREHKQRLKGQELERARKQLGVKKHYIYIEDREWEAINQGAVRKTTLRDILADVDKDRLRQLCTPRYPKGMPASKIAIAKSRIANGYLASEVAEALGVSYDTLVKAIGLKDYGN